MIKQVVCIVTAVLGRAIAQAISRRFPTAAARVRARVKSRGIYGRQRLGQVFWEYFGFPYQFSFNRLHIYHRPGLV
jgi:hypothetical protein